MVRNPDGVMQAVPIAVAQQMLARTLPLLERKVDDAIAGKPATVDLVVSNVEIIDSAGLNWILAVQARLEGLGIKLRLVDPSLIMADVLLATRLDSRLVVEYTAAAVANLGGDNGR
jgi:anti-anti-sigma factor